MFLDENGSKLDEIDMGVDSDMSYSKSLKNKVVFYGPGGLIVIDKATNTVQKITNRIVGEVQEDENGELYYYEKIGDNETKNSDEYITQICKYNGDCIKFNGKLLMILWL